MRVLTLTMKQQNGSSHWNKHDKLNNEKETNHDGHDYHQN